MASTSSSSHMIPSSSSQSWNHDVFLSFRGEDTRKTFVDHLYSALVQQGIHTYKDDETLPRGESIGPSLLKAIRESRIAVIVLSENYADSSWCLDELAYIMECMDERGQIVMPVFYDVDPSDVRKQKGKYGDAFAKHELENNHKVESWRKALANVGNLSGWVPKDIANGHEAKCIKDIVGTISSRLSPLMLKVNKGLIGMETRMRELKSKLEVGSGGVRIIGIWGVGGGGKTTLASSTYAEISQHFEAHCLVENIREEASKHGLRMLQIKIISLVLKTTHVEVESEEEGRCMIKSRLCHKNVLIVLDDVDNVEQLEALAGSHDWFGEGSRIIITTRDEHLLTRKADVIYGVSLLSHDEAIELFRRYSYREDKPVEDYDKLSQDVISYADGLPLALKVLGSFLYDKEKDEWMSALARLRDIPNPRIMDKLKISYDGLEADEKELFLDIACFFKGCTVDEGMMLLDAFSFHPVIGVKVLVQKSLITVLDGIFDMHDLVEEMAHYIVRGEQPKHPETYSRVWLHEDVQEVCAKDTTKDNDKIEVLLVGGNEDPRLLHVVEKMKNLRWLGWEEYPESSLPTNFQPSKLRCLMLIEGSQKQLWQGCKHLPFLKMLDLRDSENLIRTPDFNGLPCLERLNLKGCKGLKEIHPSIGYHERLVFIDMKKCIKVKRFPPIIQMRKLETLILSKCYHLEKFPEIQTNMDSLIKLCLNSTAIKIVPSYVGECCTNLVCLDLRKCEKLKRIEGNIRLLKHLKELRLEGCWELDNLSDDFFDVECSLEMLSLCTKSNEEDLLSIKNLMMDLIGFKVSHQDLMSIKFPQFPRFLRNLSLSHCNLGDGDIPSGICELLNLQVLDLSGNEFSRLHSSLSGIPRLKFLSLSYCYMLAELPDLPSSIAVLKATNCYSLKQIADLSKYKWLWKVSLWRPEKLVGVGKVVHSILQGNVAENHFMSVTLAGGPNMTFDLPYKRKYTLQLPKNWHTHFSGFLIWVDNLQHNQYLIAIEQVDETCVDSPPDPSEKLDNNLKSDEYAMAGYISFGSLRHTSWWNPAFTKLSFDLIGVANPRVVLVPRKSKADSMERTKGSVEDCSEFWNEEAHDGKTFYVIDFKSSVRIHWIHGYS